MAKRFVHNFDLETSRHETAADGSERFKVRVISSPHGEQSETLAEGVGLPAGIRTQLRRLEKRKLTRDEIFELGETLGKALFPARVRSLFDRSRSKVGDEGLRIRLRMDSYALADVPWEYTYLADPDIAPEQKHIGNFLLFDPNISLTRYEIMGRPVDKLEPVGAGTLRLVSLLANPASTPQLGIESEQQNIRRALQGMPDIHPEFYPNATIDMLLEALTKGAHIFHFAGHGTFEGEMGQAYGSQDGRGYIILTDDDGQEVKFSAEKLSLNLAGKGVRLAVLGACESAKVNQINAWTGIASALTRAGVPAVVGMQFKVYDKNAIAFSRAFFRTLVAGNSVDEAVANGRKAIFTISSDEDERDWGVPVLYLRSQEGTLFPASEDDSHAQSSATRGVSAQTRGSALASTDPGVDKRALREALIQAFSIEELDTLCFNIQNDLDEAGQNLQINMEMVGGISKSAKVLNLIEFLNRRGLLSYLVKAVRSVRSDII